MIDLKGLPVALLFAYRLTPTARLWTCHSHCRLLQKLQLRQPRVGAAQRQQLGVGAQLH